MKVECVLLVCATILVNFSGAEDEERILPQLISYYKWECIKGFCEKFPLTEENKKNAVSLEACKMLCGDDANIWPKPTGPVKIGSRFVTFNSDQVNFAFSLKGPVMQLMKSATQRVTQQLKERSRYTKTGSRYFSVEILISDDTVTRLTLDTDESYNLKLQIGLDNFIKVTIKAKTFFGARHALETLQQLIIYDNIRNELRVINSVDISDKPVYTYRGVLLDTARNYYTVPSIKRTIDGMAAAKLNTFHWHLTDTHSFSFVAKSQPSLSEIGGYSSKMVYTPREISDIIKYAEVRGVRVLPEFDAPSHVGEGWQETDVVVCFMAEPWRDFCLEPPCGQLNPTKKKVYNILEDIYGNIFDMFQPDLFHMGGDEVSVPCWNSSEQITNWMDNRQMELNVQGFVQLWAYFQYNAVERAYKANKNKKLPIILWMSDLTLSPRVTEYLPVNDYIIQVWYPASFPGIKDLLSKGYKVIISNFDALYLDCGFSTWVGDAGNNWCSPYIGWQKIYDNSPLAIAGKEYSHLVLGGEAALWSEQSDSSSLDTRLWPRVAALAERLWAEPSTPWQQAEQRMLHFRERLVSMGIGADALKPRWCYENEGHCY